MALRKLVTAINTGIFSLQYCTPRPMCCTLSPYQSRMKRDMIVLKRCKGRELGSGPDKSLFATNKSPRVSDCTIDCNGGMHSTSSGSSAATTQRGRTATEGGNRQSSFPLRYEQSHTFGTKIGLRGPRVVLRGRCKHTEMPVNCVHSLPRRSVRGAARP